MSAAVIRPASPISPGAFINARTINAGSATQYINRSSCRRKSPPKKRNLNSPAPSPTSSTSGSSEFKISRITSMARECNERPAAGYS